MSELKMTGEGAEEAAEKKSTWFCYDTFTPRHSSSTTDDSSDVGTFLEPYALPNKKSRNSPSKLLAQKVMTSAVAGMEKISETGNKKEKEKERRKRIRKRKRKRRTFCS